MQQVQRFTKEAMRQEVALEQAGKSQVDRWAGGPGGQVSQGKSQVGRTFREVRPPPRRPRGSVIIHRVPFTIIFMRNFMWSCKPNPNDHVDTGRVLAYG